MADVGAKAAMQYITGVNNLGKSDTKLPPNLLKRGYYLEQKHKYILNYIHDYKNDKNKNKMQEDSHDL